MTTDTSGCAAWSDDLRARIYATLQHYANEASYAGERTGGVLRGCPRGPAPSAADMTADALMLLREIDALVPAPDRSAQVAEVLRLAKLYGTACRGDGIELAQAGDTVLTAKKCADSLAALEAAVKRLAGV